jgi:hypothetical protein
VYRDTRRVPDTSMKSMLFTLDEATDAYYVVILKG